MDDFFGVALISGNLHVGLLAKIQATPKSPCSQCIIISETTCIYIYNYIYIHTHIYIYIYYITKKIIHWHRSLMVSHNFLGQDGHRLGGTSPVSQTGGFFEFWIWGPCIRCLSSWHRRSGWCVTSIKFLKPTNGIWQDMTSHCLLLSIRFSDSPILVGCCCKSASQEHALSPVQTTGSCMWGHTQKPNGTAELHLVRQSQGGLAGLRGCNNRDPR